jgi:hypothetical protein
VSPCHDDGDDEDQPEQRLASGARSHLALECDDFAEIARVSSKGKAKQRKKEARRAEDGEPRPTRMGRQFGSDFGGQRRHDPGQQGHLHENLDDVRQRRDSYNKEARELNVHRRGKSSTLCASVEGPGRTGATPSELASWRCARRLAANSSSAKASNDPIEKLEDNLHFVEEGKPVNMRYRIDEMKTNDSARWTCVANDGPSWGGTSLSWRIKDAGGSILVSFEHDGWKEPPPEMIVQSWKHFLGGRKAYVETGTGQPW